MRTSALVILLSATTLTGTGCTTNIYKEYYVMPPTSDTTTSTASDSGTDSDIEVVPGPSNCNTYVGLAELPIDLWADGNHYYFEVSEEQQAEMDMGSGDYGDQYGFEEAGTYADNIEIQPVDSDTCSNTGQVGVELPGQSSWRDWDGIPNIHVDVNDFQEDLTFPSGDKALRLNNGQAESGIQREYTATKIWRELYYGPQSAFAIITSNIWDEDFGPGSWAAEVAVQPYKGQFFADNLPNVTNVFEGTGELISGWGWDGTFECQWSSSEDDQCDEAVLQNAKDVIAAAPYGEGFRAATDSVIDWEAYWTYQCVTNLTGVWDNYSHNWNNVVIAFDVNGKLIILPYSTDISAEHPWYPSAWYGADFNGNSYLGAGCEADMENCYIPELEYCRDVVIPAFRTLDVNTTIVDPAWDSLNQLAIVRDGDDSQHTTIHTFYAETADRVEAQVQTLLDCYDMPVMYGGGQAGGGGDTGSGYIPCGGSDTGYW